MKRTLPSIFERPTAVATARQARDFLRALKNAEHPDALVAALAPQDLLIAWGEADDEQRAELLTLASKEQFDALVDMRCWRGYEIDVPAVLETVAPLVRQGVPQAITALRKLDEDVRTLLFQQYVIVHLRENKDEDFPVVPDTSELIETPDGYYAIEIPDADAVPDEIRLAIQALLFLPFATYQPELEAIRHELRSDTEETALRWRTARLADLGFLPYDEARTLLYPVSPEAVREAVHREPSPPMPADIPLPATYVEGLRDAPLLRRAVAALEESSLPAHQERLAHLPAELSAMLNQFVTAVRADLADPERIAAASRHGLALAEYGLHLVTGGDVTLARDTLAAVAPGRLVQAAMGRLAPLRQKAQACIQKHKEQCRRFDDVYRMTVDLLSRDLPLWDPQLTEYDGFSTLVATASHEWIPLADDQRVAAAERLLEEAAFVAASWPDQLAPPEGIGADVPHSTIVATALAHYRQDGVLRPVPLDPAAARAFVTDVCDEEADAFVATATAVIATAVDGVHPCAPPIHTCTSAPDRAVARLCAIVHKRATVGDPDLLLVTS